MSSLLEYTFLHSIPCKVLQRVRANPHLLSSLNEEYTTLVILHHCFLTSILSLFFFFFVLPSLASLYLKKFKEKIASTV